MHCQDCKYWRALIGPEYYPEVHRTWGQCSLGASAGGLPAEVHTRAFASDSEEYAASLMTAPDFGCVQFEPLG